MSATIWDESGPVSVSRDMSVALWDKSGSIYVSRGLLQSGMSQGLFQ